MDPTPSFGQWLKARRRALDLTQDALAERAGCAGETIRKVEANGIRPSRQLAALLAAHLDLTPDEHAAFVAWARGSAPPPVLRALNQSDAPATLPRTTTATRAPALIRPLAPATDGNNGKHP